MTNHEIAKVLNELADYLELTGENRFRINSYRNAARTLEELSAPVAQMSPKEIEALPGIGQSMSQKIHSLVSTGKLPQYDQMKKKVPADVLKMLEVPGLGPKTVSLLREKLGVKTFADLDRALQSEKLAGLPGMGAKKIEKIREGLRVYRGGHQRKLLGDVLPVAEALADAVRKIPGVKEVTVAGSLRRMAPTIGDVDILAQARDGAKAIASFVKLPGVREVLAQGDTKGAVRLQDNLQVDLRIVEEESYGAALQYFTGSKAHGVHVREIAKAKGLTLNEYGVFRGKRRLAGKDEADVYRAIGLDWMPPELREDRGEVELALKHRLPKLVELKQIRGDVHVHSKASDGTRSIAEMADVCRQAGYRWMVLTDHSRSLKVARGLTVADLRKQRREIDKLNEKLNDFRVLAGTEVDILADGSIDFPNDVLEELDLVVASVHSRMDDPRGALTARVIRALENPHVDILGHPTGKRTGMREPMDLDMEKILDAAAKTGTALEINGQPERMDLPNVLVQEAVKRNCLLALGTDSHRLSHIAFMRLAVAVARRGWAGPRSVLNTLSARELLDWRKRKR